MSTIEFTEALMDIETNLKSFALGFTRNQEDAKDLTQDTMLKAINYKPIIRRKQTSKHGFLRS